MGLRPTIILKVFAIVEGPDRMCRKGRYEAGSTSLKKVLISLLVILIAAGVVFYFGWIQFLIPDDGYGVVFSRSHGWEEEPVRPGDFEWRWQRLIPTNMEVYVFDASPVDIDLSASGSLPSEEVYRTVLADDPDLSFELDVSLRVAVRASSLPSLAQDDGVRPDTFDEWMETQSDRMRTKSMDFLVDLLSDAENTETLGIGNVESELKAFLENEFPAFRFASVSLRSYRVPDFALYREARSLYLEQMEAETDALLASAAERADREARDEEIQRSLRSYAEVLDEFPVLLEYFELGVDPFRFEQLFESE